MKAPRSLQDLREAYAAYRAKGGALPLTAFAEQVGYTLDECLRAECEGATVGRKAALPRDGAVVTVTEPPPALAEKPKAEKPKRRR